ncbi:MAG: hypothetical protein K6E91_15055 [Butyrivibrio sp.]|nr:hypothetical protein [Butyrivibrio sp.]
MKIFKNGKMMLKRMMVAGMSAAMIAVCSQPLSVSAQVQERPPEIPESEFINKGSQGQKAIPPEYPDGADRPRGEDFEWVQSVDNIFNVPAGAQKLSISDNAKGDWKAFLVGTPTDKLCFYATFNAKITDNGNNNVTFKADWYNQTLVDRNTGEGGKLDTTMLPDEVYYGGTTTDSLLVTDPDTDSINRYMFASGDMIKEFIIVNMYQSGNRQCALGVFYGDNEKSLGNIFMTRTGVAPYIPNSAIAPTLVQPKSITSVLTGSKTKSNGSAAASDWSAYEGYWVYEFTDESTGNVQRDTFYIERKSDDTAYCVICDESIPTWYGVLGKVALDPDANELVIYYPDGSIFDVVSFIGKDEIDVATHGGSFYKKDKSLHSQNYWDFIDNKFATSDEWAE